MNDQKNDGKYTCNDYREEMILAGLRKRLQQENLTESERLGLLQEIEVLEEKMGLL
jgi:hypothetical protein